MMATARLELDWLIIGGGVHGVHIAANLLGKCAVDGRDLRIIDPGQRLLERWRANTSVIGMTCVNCNGYPPAPPTPHTTYARVRAHTRNAATIIPCRFSTTTTNTTATATAAAAATRSCVTLTQRRLSFLCTSVCLHRRPVHALHWRC